MLRPDVHYLYIMQYMLILGRSAPNLKCSIMKLFDAQQTRNVYLTCIVAHFPPFPPPPTTLLNAYFPGANLYGIMVLAGTLLSVPS